MSVEISVFKEVKAMIIGNEAQLMKLIPPKVKELKVRTILDQIEHQIKFSKNGEKLRACEPHSIAAAIKYCCQMGLEPGYGNGTPDVFLIPYNKECKTEISYRGELNLAMREGKFKQLYSDVVYASDTFRAWNNKDGQHFDHEMGELGGKTDDNIVAVYATAMTTDGSSYFEIMTKDEIDALEAKTRKGSTQTPAWKNWWTQMARKTLVRRVVKNLPQSSAQALAESLDNQANTIDVIAETTNIKQFKTSQDVIG